MHKAPGPSSRLRKTPPAALRSVVAYLPLGSIVPDPSNPRKHSPEQIRAIARSIEAFGFNAPILVDKANRIVAGQAGWRRRSGSNSQKRR